MSNEAATQPSPPAFPKLSEHNYHSWKFDMQALLIRTSGWLVVDGILTEPSNRATSEWKEWAISNMNAAGLIYSHVDPSIQPLIRDNLGNASSMWSTLESQYSKDNAASRFLAYDEFLSISKQQDESLTSLVARVEDTLQKLRSSRSETLTIDDFEAQLAAMVLIRALPEEFTSFKSSLLLLDSSISLKSVKEAFLQEERTRQPCSSEMAMFAASGKQQQRRRGQGNRQQHRGDPKDLLAVPCTHPTCRNRRNHCAAECFIRANEIAARNPKREKANQAQDTPQEQETAEFAGNASSFDFTDPYSPLVSDAGTDWIADTGATCHMTPHRH